MTKHLNRTGTLFILESARRKWGCWETHFCFSCSSWFMSLSVRANHSAVAPEWDIQFITSFDIFSQICEEKKVWSLLKPCRYILLAVGLPGLWASWELIQCWREGCMCRKPSLKTQTEDIKQKTRFFVQKEPINRTNESVDTGQCSLKHNRIPGVLFIRSSARLPPSPVPALFELSFPLLTGEAAQLLKPAVIQTYLNRDLPLRLNSLLNLITCECQL